MTLVLCMCFSMSMFANGGFELLKVAPGQSIKSNHAVRSSLQILPRVAELALTGDCALICYELFTIICGLKPFVKNRFLLQSPFQHDSFAVADVACWTPVSALRSLSEVVLHLRFWTSQEI